MAYSKGQYEMMRASYVSQFGEVDGTKLFELQKNMMEIAEQGSDEINMKRLREASDKFNALFEELNAKIIAQSYAEDDDDYDDDPRHNGLIDQYDDDDNDDDDDYDYYDDDDLPEQKTEYEKILILYTDVFGKENGALLAGYMARISQINNDEGVNDENRAERDELMAKYQKLLDSLGGQQRIIEYAQNAYNNQDNDNNDEYDDDDDEESTAGIDAINEAVEELYSDQEGFCFGTKIPYSLGGNDPLDMVRIFESESGGMPHWHYITYGFTELYGKESNDKDKSGFGFELTFRLKKNESEPPLWPINLLQNIARYVFNTGNVFAPGHHMNANGPIRLGYDTDITALAFINDPELPDSLETENGDMRFIEMVGITNDEMEAIMMWDCEKLMNVFEEFIPFGITDLDRKSLMTNENIQEAFKNGIEDDGSSTSHIYTDFIAVGITDDSGTKVYGSDVNNEVLSKNNDNGILTIYLGAAHVHRVVMMLRGRLLKGRKFVIYGKEAAVFFVIGDSCKVEVNSDDDVDNIFVTLTKEAIEEMTKVLLPKAGEYKMDSGNINFRIVKTEIRDSNGNVVETVG